MHKEHRPMTKHLTIKDFAEREGVPVATVYRWNTRGEGPRYLRIGRHVRYRLADVEEWERTKENSGGQAA